MGDLFPKIDLKEFLENCRWALKGAKLVGDLFASPTKVVAGQQLEVITKAAVVRRVGALETSLSLAEIGRAIDSAVLIRPAIEENL